MRLVPLCTAALFACLGSACRDATDSAAPTAGASSIEDVVLREQVVATFTLDRDRPQLALDALAPLLAREPAAPEDLLRGATLALLANDLERSRQLLARAEAAGAEAGPLAYLQARIAHLEGDIETELRALRSAHAAAPDDPATMLLLGSALVQNDIDVERGEDLLREVLELGVDNASPWVPGAAYQLLLSAGRRGDEEARRSYKDLFDSFERRGHKAPNAIALNQGRLARVVPAQPTGSQVPRPSVPGYTPGPWVLPELGGARELALDDLDGDRRPDVVAAGPQGLWVTRWDEGTLRATRLAEGDARLARAFDLHNDGDTLDLIFVLDGALALLEQAHDGAWEPTPLALPQLPAAPDDQSLVDFDHDGDLDLFVVGPFGRRLYRNDGAGRLIAADGNEYPRGSITDVTQEAGLAGEPKLTWCATEDLDSDQDVDLISGEAQALTIASNLRGGRFREYAEAAFGDHFFARRPHFADLNGDGRVDAIEPGSREGQAASLWLQDAAGVMRAEATTWNVPPGRELAALDIDLDGALDLLWPGSSGTFEGVLACGLPQATPVSIGDEASDASAIALADLDFAEGRRADIELVELGPQGLRIWRVDGRPGNATRLKLAGRKDNRQAVGTIVEMRAGPIYRRVYVRGQALTLGYGSRASIDVVRITWPNGVIQSLVDVLPGDRFPPTDSPRDYGFDTSGVTTESVAQDEGLVGSCPFLYTWNGTTYTFVSDVLGITPLGLPMAPGQLVPPDHDEYVLVSGEQLVPRAGRLTLQVTEELREVTYLDHARLQAIDHPADTEIFPDERFCFPPFPEAHVHTVTEPIAPERAVDQSGRDWQAELEALDAVHAVPFTRLPPQYQGLTSPHTLELSFDRARVAEASRLRLVCTGWLRWSNASVNMAAARTPGVAFVPPILQVPGDEGAWVDSGPPVGFPAGKTKTMVIDVTSILRRDDPRLRIFSTLELYWDRIVLAVDDDDASLEVRELPVDSAELAWRGFSAPFPVGEADNPQPERFDWDSVESSPRWNQHPGRYTRYGPCRELLDDVDDRFVVLGAGDALELSFDATELPPLRPGWVRDWLVYLDGWAKDRDPNTVEALTVEPLPFHGMSGYPYGPDEHFPTSELHETWRAEWQTREAYRPIVPLAPASERAWVRAGGRNATLR